MSHFVRSYKRRKVFLDQLACGDSITKAAYAAGGTPANFRAWRKTDDDFAKDWDDAIEEGTDFIEDVATERAMKKSDPLMQMILKARRPEKYDRGSKLELSGGISVEGSKAKLLNRLARLQAQGQVAQESTEGESPILEGTAVEKVPALPAPDTDRPIKGRKRRAAAEGSRREAAS